MPIVSIIVPVYNIAGEYLHQCLQSLQEQTLKDIEIILIDDGSPDNCGKICDSYSSKDRRIRVIHQENQGVSVARNNGMKIASAKWLMFVDADDWLEKDTCEKVYFAAEELDVDILYFAGYKEWIDSSVRMGCDLPNKTLLSISDKAKIYRNCIYSKYASLYTFACYKLYRTAELRKASICFLHGYALGEDKLFLTEAITKLHRIAYLNESYYHYRARASSAVGNTYRHDMEKQLTRYLSSLQNILYASDLTSSAAEKAFYALVVLELRVIICRQLMHKNNPISYKDKIRACKELVNRPIYNTALKKVDISLFTTKQKLPFILIRTHMFSLLSLLQNLWDRFAKKRWYD